MGTADQFLSLLAEHIAEEAVKRLIEKLKALQSEPLLYSMSETAIKLGLSLTTVKQMVSNRELLIVRRGSRVLISRRSIDAWINTHET